MTDAVKIVCKMRDEFQRKKTHTNSEYICAVQDGYLQALDAVIAVLTARERGTP